VHYSKQRENNKMIDALIFDLDGTLWDTTSTCALAWNIVLQKNDIDYRKITKEDIEAVMGMPHNQCIEKTFSDLCEKKISTLISQTMIEDNKLVRDLGGDLYLGVPETLHRLAEKYKLFIVSNCQEGYIESFLDFTDFSPLFKDFECWGNTRSSKASNISAIIDRNELVNPVYIGDTQSDFDAALECQIDFIFASYGFGSVNSDCHSFNQIDELEEILQKLNEKPAKSNAELIQPTVRSMSL
jgi:phosphoglycolate phosphatase